MKISGIGVSLDASGEGSFLVSRRGDSFVELLTGGRGVANVTLGGEGAMSLVAVMGVLVCLGEEGSGVDLSGVLLGVSPSLLSPPGVWEPGEKLLRLRPPTGLLFFLDRGLLGTETAMGGSVSAATSCCLF